MDSMNEMAVEIVDKMVNRAEDLQITATRSTAGPLVIDCGVKARGSYEAGRLMTEVCLGGLGKAEIFLMKLGGRPIPAISVSTNRPALACLGSQMIGWEIKEKGYSGFVSGPARILAQKPERIYKELDYEERSREAVLVIESKALPPDSILIKMAGMCGVSPRRLYVLVAPLTSITGSTQVAGRSVEAGLHKMHRLGFDVKRVLDAKGKAPIAPIVRNERLMMGRINDMILAASQAWYTVDGGGADLSEFVKKVPSSTSVHYGKPFFEILCDVDFDFLRVDPDIFSVAEVFITDAKSRKTYHAGKIDFGLVHSSLKLT